MCGILALLSDYANEDPRFKKLIHLIEARGPDYSSEIVDHQTRCGLKLGLKCSILHLMGTELQKQPMIDCDGNILLFNGQIYAFSGSPLNEDCSDTKFLSDTLRKCSTPKEIAECLSRVTGPFAIVYWCESLNILVYGRDMFGRKSLCALSNGKTDILASVSYHLACSERPSWSEVDSSRIHCIQFQLNSSPRIFSFVRNIGSTYHRTDKCQSQSSPRELDADSIDYGPKDFKPLNSDTMPWADFTNEDHKNTLIRFEHLLLQSVARRIQYNKQECLICRKSVHLKPPTRCTHSKVVIAFSGGIDSTILAYAVDQLLEGSETIDLVNVAFRDNAPDRLSARDALIELIKVKPKRNWRLILCDVRVGELQEDRDNTIRHLIHPCDTVVDDSLGCGCWYIGRALGRSLDSREVPLDDLEATYENFCRYDPKNEKNLPHVNLNYTSPASMMFVGSGIDEQLGGYSSYRAAWSSSGAKGLIDEISFQMRRISTRNLGRDDRVYSHHGRDVKLPYLDENLVSFLNDLPVGKKMDLSKPSDLGPKMLIRQLAMKWKLEKTSRRVKRALQFGTKIANLENTKEKGSDKCRRL